MLRRAIELLALGDGVDDGRVTDLLQQVAAPARTGVTRRRGHGSEALYVKGNRFRDVLRLNERGRSPRSLPPPEATKRKLLARIVELYADKLHEPEAGDAPHVELLLAADPANEVGARGRRRSSSSSGASRVARQQRSRPRARRSGTPQEVARYRDDRAREHARPQTGRAPDAPRQAQNTSGWATTRAPSRPSSRRSRSTPRTTGCVASTSSWPATAEALLGRGQDPRPGADRRQGAGHQGEDGSAARPQLLYSGDPKRAKSTLGAVLAVADAPDEAVLVAARALWEILEKDNDPRALSASSSSGWPPSSRTRSAAARSTSG